MFDILEEDCYFVPKINLKRESWLSAKLNNPRKKTLRTFDHLLFGNTARHSIYRDAVFITDRLLGCSMQTFKSQNSKLGLFYTNGEYSKRDGIVQPWWYTDKALSIITEYYETHDFLEMALENTKEYKLRLNIAALGRALEQHKISPQNIPEAFKLIRAVADEPKCLARYERSDCGRLFTQMGDYSLQRMPKELRKIVMDGWYQYDVRNCHIAIANTYGSFPTFTKYSESVDKFREEIGDVDNVKTALLAMLYGAGEDGLKKILGDGYDSFINHPNVIGFKEDCIKIKPLLMKEAKELGFSGNSSSKMGKALMKKESEILDICIQGVYNPVLLFDGFLTPKRVENLEDIEKKVLTKTGIYVTLTENEI